MTPIVPRYLRGDVPLEDVVTAFNQFQQDVIAALQAVDSDTRGDIIFTTEASGSTIVPVSHALGRTAKRITCSTIHRADAQPVVGPWSIEWTNITTGLMEVTFTGLTASTQHVASFLVE